MQYLKPIVCHTESYVSDFAQTSIIKMLQTEHYTGIWIKSTPVEKKFVLTLTLSKGCL